MPQRPRLASLLILIPVLGLFGSALHAADPAPAGVTAPEEIVVNGRKKQHYRIPRAASAVQIDGHLDEEAWTRGLVMEVNNEIDPQRNVPAPVTTVAYLTYDDDNLYVGFRANDPNPAEIRAHLADRDTPFRDDFVGIIVDTFNDERGGYEFFVNPLGVQMDLALNETDPEEEEDPAWDAIWSTAGRIDEQGYVVEIAIPFSSLRFQRSGEAAAGEQTWGLTPFRSYPRNQRHQITAGYHDPDDNCLVCQMPKVTGFAGATPGRNLEIAPTVTAQRTDLRESFPSGSLEEGDYEAEAGLTARWGITPNLTFSGAINPDFSQVEADVAQLDVNTQFALFFPEKRPFFLEGADYFDSAYPVVYTRTVADPSWGVKLTGKEGQNGIGLFVAQDEVTNLLLPGSQRSARAQLDQETTDAVLRYRRDLGGMSNVGAIVTHREGEDYQNSVYGVDGLWRPTGSDKVRLQYLDSRTEYPGALAAEIGLAGRELDGAAFRAAYEHSTREWLWYARYDDVDPGFRADLGFMPQVGYRVGLAGVERTWRGGQEDWYSRILVGGDWNRSEDPDGFLLEEEVETWLGIGGPMQSFFFLDTGRRERTWNRVRFEETFWNLDFEIRPSGSVAFEFEASVGDTIDLAHTRAADEIEIEPALTLDLGRSLRLTLLHSFQRLDVEEGRLLEANLSEIRGVYQFNIRTFVRAIVQYAQLDQNPALFAFPVEPEEEGLFSQLLFSYKLNPQTVLFLGYSDNYQGGTLEARPLDLTQTDRTLFFKVGYALVM